MFSFSSSSFKASKVNSGVSKNTSFASLQSLCNVLHMFSTSRHPSVTYVCILHLIRSMYLTKYGTLSGFLSTTKNSNSFSSCCSLRISFLDMFLMSPSNFLSYIFYQYITYSNIMFTIINIVDF